MASLRSSGPGWFYVKDRQKLGPVSLDHLCQLAASGWLQPTDMVLQDGTPKWVAAGTVPELFSVADAVPTVSDQAILVAEPVTLSLAANAPAAVPVAMPSLSSPTLTAASVSVESLPTAADPVPPPSATSSPAVTLDLETHPPTPPTACWDAIQEAVLADEPPQPVASDKTKPTRIGRFEIRQRLGEGAFGVVYRAYDAQLDREVALKVAKPNTLNTEQRVKRFLREAKAAANLRHPNIVPVFDSGKDGEQYYIASAFIPGKSLEGVLEEQPQGQGLELSRAAEIVRRLAEALAYAHGKGVIHRDIKPANAMLDDQGEPMLLDFGLAARADGDEKLTQEATIMGTPAYMAPEQAAGQAEAASDQYSLGCTFYELLTGQTPFSGPPEIQIFLHQSKDPPTPRKLNPTLPRDLETICLKCLAKKTTDRYPTCRELADDLRRWLEGEPITARRWSMRERVVRWVKKEPVLAGAMAAVLLTMTLALVLVTNEQAKTAREQRERALAQVNTLLDANPQAVLPILDGLQPYRETVNPHLRELMAQSSLSDAHRVRVSLALNQARFPGSVSRKSEKLEILRRFRGFHGYRRPETRVARKDFK